MTLTFSTPPGVRQAKKSKRSKSQDAVLTLVKHLQSLETLQSVRDKLSDTIKERQAEEAETTKRRPSFRATACSEEDLRQVDQKQHAFRAVGRMLRAGQSYKYIEKHKGVCLQDFKLLLGGLFDTEAFPVWGGRKYIAGILSRLLCRQVSLVDINCWLYVSNSQSMGVHQELLDLLSPLGLTWPPNAHMLPLCASYQSTGNEPPPTSSAILSDEGFNLYDQEVELSGCIMPGPHNVFFGINLAELSGESVQGIA